MGWSGGSRAMGAIITALQGEVLDKETRVRIYEKVVAELEDMDWDNQDECLGDDEAFDEVMVKMHPDWFLEREY